MKWVGCAVVAIALLACGDDDPVVRDAAVDDAANEDTGAEDSGSVDASDDAAVVSCGPLMGRTTECNACLQSACCSELMACGGDPNCTGLVACLRGCEEPDAGDGCMSACIGTHGVSSAYNPLLLCGADDCEAECPFASP